MKFIITLFLASLAFTGSVKAQSFILKKVFVSDGLEYLQFLTDSTLQTSINNDGDTTSYYKLGDTLYVKNDYWRTGANNQTDYIVEWHKYTILKQNYDTLVITNPFKGYYKPSNWEDTLRFINIQKLKEAITSFKFLRLICFNPFNGERFILIDSIGKIYYQKSEIKPAYMTETFTTYKGNFSEKGFKDFLDTLSYFLPYKLRKFRGDCDAMDAGILTIEIHYNNKVILSRGCTLDWIHALLYNYLYDLISNKEFIKD